jgi:hypothetical protein
MKPNLGMKGLEMYISLSILTVCTSFLYKSVATELGMHSWNIIIILGLKEVARNWIAKVILPCKRLDGELGARVSRPKRRETRNTKSSSIIPADGHDLTPQYRVFVLKKFPAFYRNQMFITVFMHSYSTIPVHLCHILKLPLHRSIYLFLLII